MFLGIDFGTTNTVAAVKDGSGVRVLPLDPSTLRQAQGSGESATLRTMLYIEREGKFAPAPTPFARIASRTWAACRASAGNGWARSKSRSVS